MTTTVTPRKGRPRDERIDLEVTRAALEVLADLGTDGFSVAEVSARTGVAKTTIYRRFPTRDGLLLASLERLNDDVTVPEAGLGVRGRLIEVLSAVRWRSPDSVPSKVVSQLSGAGDPSMCALAYERVLAPRHRILRDIIVDGIASGELRPDVDLDAIIPVLIGPMIYLRTWSQTPPAQGVSVEAVVDLLIAGMTRASGS